MNNIATNLFRNSRALLGAPGASVITQDEPGLELKIGWIVVLLFFGLFVGWAILTRLDSAAYAQGAITVESHRQTVQHRDGGIIKAIHVHDGQHVKAGDVLLELKPTEVHASEASAQAEIVSLLARKARLEAEQAGLTRFAAPAEFANLPAEDQPEAEQAMKLQQHELDTRVESVTSEKAVLTQRQAELQQQIIGYRKQVVATDDQSKSIGAEISGTEALAARGFAPLNHVRSLQRQASGLIASRADLEANIAKSQQSIGEARMQALNVDDKHAEEVAKDLRDVETQLNDQSPKLTALQTQVAETVIRAPATGTVVGLDVFTVGGVIKPGEKLMDVVPDNSPLVIESRFKPEDSPDLFVGQKVQVKVSAMHDRTMSNLNGSITRVSADAETDEKTGKQYYLVEVTVPTSELANLRRRHGPETSLRPGLPVQVLAPLHKRTAFQYLTEPLNQALWRSFREH
jgi:HlyD family secretion protein